MVELDLLSALDGLIWLRTGAKVAEVFACDQSTISRKAQRCLETFGLKSAKIKGEWGFEGDCSLISLERNVHQLARWQGVRPLRLEAQHWSGPMFCEPAPSGWILGNFDYLEYARPLSLLRDGVIDAWLASYPDIPEEDDPEIASIKLNRTSISLYVQDGHPLLKLGNAITFDDVAKYPSLALPENAFPKFQAVAIQCGIWNTPQKIARFQSQSWYGTMDQNALMIAYGTPMTEQFLQRSTNRLPLKVPIEVGDALLLKRAFLDNPATKSLVSLLLQRMANWAANCSELEILTPQSP